MNTQGTPQGRPPRRPDNPNRKAPARQTGLPDPNNPVQIPKRNAQSTPLQSVEPVKAVTAMTEAPIQDNTQESKPKKGKKWLIAVFAIIIAAVGGGVALKMHNKAPEEEVIETYVVSTPYEESGRYPIDNYVATLNSGDVNQIAGQVTDSWVAQEWKYANNNALHEAWLKSALAYVSVEYPQIQSVNNLGDLAFDDSDGSPLMEVSPLLNGESVDISVVDYDTLSATMQEDVQMIIDKYKESGYSPDDYLYQSEMTDLMLDYLLSKSNFPTKKISVKVDVVDAPVNTTVVEDDITEFDAEEEDIEPQRNVFDGEIQPLINDLDGLTGGDTSNGTTSANTSETTEAGTQDTTETSETTSTSTTESITTSAVVTQPAVATSDLVIKIARGADGTYILVDDSVFDVLVFGTEDYRKMLDTYGTLIYNYEYEEEDSSIKIQKASYDTYVKASEDKLKELQDKYTLKELGESPSEDALKEFKEKLKEMTWQQIAEALEITDEVELKTLDKIINVSEWKEPKRKFTTEYVPESVIPYTWSGVYYAKNYYKGDSNTIAQMGDGTFEKPAGIGTTVLTKAYGLDNQFHDVKVTLMTYKIGEDAIKYAIGYSEKNRGFDVSSQVKLICYEIKVENLENKPIRIKADMFLSDANSNQSARTGDMYGFYSEAEIPAHDSVILNDWATSTEMEQKYVCWGKSFNRQYPVVWFKLLAGSGNEVPPYDAQESYVNKNGIESFSSEEATESITTSDVEEYKVQEGTTVEQVSSDA